MSIRLLYVAARLWLDADGAQLYDHGAEQSTAQFLTFAAPEACAVRRGALPEPSEYLGDVLMLAHLGFGRSSLEIAVFPAPPGYPLRREEH